MKISTFKSNCCKADILDKKSVMICDKCKKPCAATLVSENVYGLNDYLNKKQVGDEQI